MRAFLSILKAAHDAYVHAKGVGTDTEDRSPILANELEFYLSLHFFLVGQGRIVDEGLEYDKR